MSRRGDNTMVSQTCPLINKVRDFIDMIEWADDEDNLRDGAIEALKQLEIIRQMNSDLRDFGNKQCDELEEMGKDRDYYEKKCRELEKELEYKNEEIKDLEKELNQYN